MNEAALRTAPDTMDVPKTAPAVRPGEPDSAAAPATAANFAPAAAAHMDRDFIARNQVVERYLSGTLPIKGATDFERFCREQPELLDAIGLPERVNAGLRLLEASGKPEPWREAPKRAWGKPQVLISLGALAVLLAVVLAIVASGSADKNTTIAKLRTLAREQPLEAASATRSIRLLPSRVGGSDTPAITIGGGPAQLVDLRIDMTHSPYRAFRVTIDRIDQGRVAVLHNIMKDSNGHVHLAINSSALGPGNYQFTIEGLTWSGEPEPDAWITIGIQR